MSKMSGLFIFALGAVTGAATAYIITKAKYEKIVQDEIDSVRESFERCERRKKEAAERRAEEKEERCEYAKKAAAYTRYSGRSRKDVEKEMEKKMANMPYVITPDEFGELPDYDTVTLTYYADEVLADDMEELVDDIEETVGAVALNRFGEYEDDAVYVRNDVRKVDYEILRDERTYASVVGHNVYGSRTED